MTEGEWSALRLQHDPTGESAINAILNLTEGNDGLRLHFLHEIDEVTDEGLPPIPDDFPQVVKDFFNDTATPEWLWEYGHIDEARKIAIETFDEDVVAFVLALLCKSLPECYAGAKGAAVLAFTGQLGDANYADPRVQDTLVRRVVETAVFVRNVNTEKNWEGENHRAVRTIRKVRLFHSGVRRMILNRNDPKTGKPWDIHDMGYPINQQDTIGTLLAFSLLSMRGCEQMGVPLSPEQRRAILLHWAVIGHHLGIDEPLLRAFLKDPDDLWERIRKTQFAKSVQGAALTGALVSFMERHLFVVEHKAHLPVLLMRKLMDKDAAECVNLDALGPAHDTILYEVIGWILYQVHNILLHIPGIGKKVLDMLGAEAMELCIEGWAHSRHPRITLSKELEEA